MNDDDREKNATGKVYDRDDNKITNFISKSARSVRT